MTFNVTRRTTHPGAILREDIIPAMDITPEQFAEQLGISPDDFEEILMERQPVTLEVADQLGRVLKNGAGLWLRLQESYDAWDGNVTTFQD